MAREVQKPLKTDITLQKALPRRELQELREILCDESIETMIVHRVLIDRGIRVSYSSLCRYRDRVRGT